MKKIRSLLVKFDQSIAFHELPAFRGAIATRAGTERILFHNHLGENGLRYRYPLIQYKSINGKAALLCLNEGADEVNALFDDGPPRIHLGSDHLTLTVTGVQANQYTLNIWNTTFPYRILNWQALNANNYRVYRETDPLTDRIQLLEKILTGNILSFAKGMDLRVDKQVAVKILNISAEKTRRYKGVLFPVFDLNFTSNFFLPDYIGLGKNASVGFGMVRGLRESNGNNQKQTELNSNSHERTE